MNKVIQQLNGERAQRKFPDFNPGDTIVVQVKVVEGDRERVQAYEGVVLVQGAQDFAWRGRRARVPDAQPVDQRSQHQTARRRAAREALLLARSVRQGGAHRREDLSRGVAAKPGMHGRASGGARR